MNNLLDYLFTSSWLLGALTLGYFIFLHNHKLLHFTRFYILGSLLLCLLYPLLPAIGYMLPEAFVAATSLSFPQATQYLPELLVTSETATTTFTAVSGILYLYLTGLVLVLVRFALQLLQLYKTLKRLSFQATADGFFLAHTGGDQPTFSFFRFLLINTAHIATEEEYQLVLQHEQAHARQYHSADVLFAELVQLVFWFHPATYLLNKALRQKHEHLADAAVLRASNDAIHPYIALMSRQTLAAAGIPLGSTFFQSFTLNRISMIKKNAPSTWRWRIGASMLLAASLTGFMACEKQEEPIQSPAVPQQSAYADQPTRLPQYDPTVFDIVEDEALPVGGMAAFYEYLGSNIRYPQEALEKRAEGTAYIKFIVDEQGNVMSAETIEGRELGHGLDEEAIRVIKGSKWTPAKQRGIVVKQRKILPVKFKLGNEVKQESTQNQTSMLFKQLLKTPKQESRLAKAGKGAC